MTYSQSSDAHKQSPLIRAGIELARMINNNSPRADDVLFIDNLLQISRESPFAYLDQNRNISLCCCQNCVEDGSRFTDTPRLNFTIDLLERIRQSFPNPSTPLKIASLGTGGGLHEILIHSALIALGYTSIDWTITDNFYTTDSGATTPAQISALIGEISGRAASQVFIERESPQDFVASHQPNTFDIVLMISNDNIFSCRQVIQGRQIIPNEGGAEIRQIASWEKLCRRTYILADYKSGIGEREPFRIESQGIPVQAQEIGRQNAIQSHGLFKMSLKTTLISSILWACICTSLILILHLSLPYIILAAAAVAILNTITLLAISRYQVHHDNR